MSFASFAALDLDDFLEQEAAPEALWIFMHIPRTAGSSLVSEWSTLRQPYRNIHANYPDGEKSYDAKLESAVAKFVADGAMTPFRACSGHIGMTYVSKIKAAIPQAKIVSFLRDPVERVISDFRYARTPSHPPYKEFIREYPTIESYVDSPASQNKMFKFLAPDPRLPAAEVLPFLDERMSFVGITEMYPMSFNIITRLTGSNRLPTVHKNSAVLTEHNNVERAPNLLKRVRDANEKDVALFSFVRERLLARRDQWRASLKVKPPSTIDKSAELATS